jgi:hypothetical protein
LGNGKNNATLKMVQPKFSPGLGEIDGKMILTGNLSYISFELLLLHRMINLFMGGKLGWGKMHLKDITFASFHIAC